MAYPYIVGRRSLVAAGCRLARVHPDLSITASSTSHTTAVPTDRTLVEAVARGREDALASLYDRYAQTLYAVAIRTLGERADAEETVLEAFSQVWQEADRFDPARGSVAAWLTMIARSRALDRLRSRARRERVTADAAAGEVTGTPAMGTPHDEPDDAVEGEERRTQVARALRTLPPEQREPIELAFYEGLSHSEIAARLEAPLGTVKTRIRAGMQKLREALRPLCAEEYP